MDKNKYKPHHRIHGNHGSRSGNLDHHIGHDQMGQLLQRTPAFLPRLQCHRRDRCVRFFAARTCGERRALSRYSIPIEVRETVRKEKAVYLYNTDLALVVGFGYDVRFKYDNYQPLSNGYTPKRSLDAHSNDFQLPTSSAFDFRDLLPHRSYNTPSIQFPKTEQQLQRYFKVQTIQNDSQYRSDLRRLLNMLGTSILHTNSGQHLYIIGN